MLSLPLRSSHCGACAMLIRKATSVGFGVTSGFASTACSMTMARKMRMDKICSKGQTPVLWCPVLAHYNDDGTLNAARMLAHQSWLVRNGINGFLVPGSTSEAWEMTVDEKVEFLNACRDIASTIRTQIPGLDCAPHLLAGAFAADERDTLKCMDIMQTYAAKDISGFCVCPPRGISDLTRMEESLSRFLQRGYPVAICQLPQVTQVEMPADLLRRLADKHDEFLFFKDSSGHDAVALSGMSLDGVFMVRGGEGKYAEWLVNPSSSGYDGLLLSTANVYPGLLMTLINNIMNGPTESDLSTAVELSSQLTRCTDTAFELFNSPLAAHIGGNAFTNTVRALDFWMAWGPSALEERRPLPVLKSGSRLPQVLVEQVGDVLDQERLMPQAGYVPPESMKDLLRACGISSTSSVSSLGLSSLAIADHEGLSSLAIADH